MIVLPERANPRDEATPTPTSARARQAQVSVRELFAGSFLGLPLTHLARTAWPAPELGVRVRGPWHYWWQAHYLDCIVDAGWRELADRPERPDVAASLIRDATRLVRTIRLRNGWRIINSYYDDMAWLALALERFGDLVAARDRSAGRLAAMARVLRDQVASAESDDLGGGVFWHTARSFKNVPATAPAAILLARAGEFARARQHIDWIHERLLDPATGLVLDGIELERADHPPVTSIWTYNQGTVLGALAALASGPQSRPEDANRAAALVAVGLEAAAVALECGATLDQVAAALAGAGPVSARRMQVSTRADGVTVINDAYNANPDSMAAGLKALAWMSRSPEGRRRSWAVLGEMAELGDESITEHDRIGRLVVRLDVSRLIVVGSGRPMSAMLHGAVMEGSWGSEATPVADADAALALLRDELQAGDVVLVKASNSAGLGALAEALAADDTGGGGR